VIAISYVLLTAGIILNLISFLVYFVNAIVFYTFFNTILIVIWHCNC